MKKAFTLTTILILAFNMLNAANGDTTYLKVFNTVSWNHYGNFDKWGVFPPATKKFQRIFMKYTVSCESGGQCEWDYTNTIYARQNTGTKDSTLKKATTFTVGGAVKDSINYSTDTTWITSYNATTKKTDSVPSTKLTIIHFIFVSQIQPQVPVDTIKVWPVQYYKYYFDSTGKKTDSVFVAVKQTERAVYTNYYSVFDKIIDYELGRMITPYAVNGSLPRPFGYEYLYDVTDYASLLHDSVQIRFNYSGYSWGFTGTIEFFMIEGTPAREAYKVENVWNGYFTYGSSTNPIESKLTPVTFAKDASTASVKLRMTISGHGGEKNENCSEFCEKYFVLKLNNDTVIKRTVWKDDCGSNPIINQGGTWIYNRANWCPGMIINPYEYNLKAISGNNTIDVDMEPFTANGSAGYAYGSQLIYYRNNAFDIDASVEKILSPTTEFIYNRSNPICDNAVILIRNSGTLNLTNAVIKYQVGDGLIQTFNWNGNLAFDEKVEVLLPNVLWSNPSGIKNFKVWVDKVNGQTDQNPFNDTKTSSFILPDVLPLSFYIETRTNNNPKENSYSIKTYWGSTVFTKTYDQPNTFYKDTFNLGYGCYTFNFVDSAGDGLSFWANTAQGSGSVRFMKLSPIAVLKTFNADFGNFLNYNFRVGTPVDVKETSDFPSLISIFPQPANNIVSIKSDKIYITHVRLISIDGRTIRSYNESEMINGELNIADINSGVYFLHISGANGEQAIKKLVIAK